MSRGALAYWALFAGTLAVWGIMAAWTLPRIAAEAGGLVPFDMRPRGYGPEEARAFLAALSAEGRALYLGPQHRLDIVYPTALAAVLGIGLWHLAAGAPRALRWGLVAAAVLAGAADHAENALVAGMLRTDPAAVSDAAVERASSATVAKSALTAVAGSALLAALAWRGATRWRR